MNSLKYKKFVVLSRYINGEFWELTDKGHEVVKNYRLFENLSPDEIIDLVCNKI